MEGSFVIGLREGLEAALIVGILIAYLSRSSAREQIRAVWYGSGLAVIVSVVVAALLQFVGATITGAAEKLFEGTIMIIAAFMLAWMVFWMARRAAFLKSELQQSAASASRFALGGLAFVAVGREGIETTLFLTAAAFSSTGVEALIGGLAGIIAAIAIGWALFRGSMRLNLKVFFTVSGGLLLLFGAGLLAHGIHEFQEAGLLLFGEAQAWSTRAILPHSDGFGKFLRAGLGYSDSPSVLEVGIYLTYVAAMGAVTFLITRRPRKLRPQSSSADASDA